VDNASAIVKIDCEEEPLPAIEDPFIPLIADVVIEEPAKVTVPTIIKEPEIKNVDKADEPRILSDLDRKKLEAGQTIRVKSLYFQADSSRIEFASYPVLDEIQRFLIRNPDVVIEIGGHTSTGPPNEFCDRLSKARAKAVTDYLLHEGVNMNQLSYKGYGKRHPIVRDDQKNYKSARKLNQRVEIKVMSLDGD
jgi:outer membrane protein OmpA-like peptidoglycan-associated protein